MGKKLILLFAILVLFSGCVSQGSKTATTTTFTTLSEMEKNIEYSYSPKSLQPGDDVFLLVYHKTNYQGKTIDYALANVEVNIFLNGRNVDSYTTDDDGECAFSLPYKGEYQILLEKENYYSTEFVITVSDILQTTTTTSTTRRVTTTIRTTTTRYISTTKQHTTTTYPTPTTTQYIKPTTTTLLGGGDLTTAGVNNFINRIEGIEDISEGSIFAVRIMDSQPPWINHDFTVQKNSGNIFVTEGNPLNPDFRIYLDENSFESLENTDNVCDKINELKSRQIVYLTTYIEDWKLAMQYNSISGCVM